MTSSKSRRVQPRQQERRRNRRLIVTPLVYLKVLPNNGGLLLDLSESGMCVSLANPLVTSKEIRFSFSLVEPRMIEGVGRICWLSASRRKAGVQFAEGSDTLQEQIAAWLSHEGTLQEEVAPRVRLEERKEAEAQPRNRARGADTAESHREEEAGSRDRHGREGYTDRISSNRKRDVAELPPDLDSRAPAADDLSRQEPRAPAVSRQDSHVTIPDTPLFFLPRKKAEDENSFPDSSSEATEWTFAERRGEGPSCDSATLRSALAAGSAEKEDESRKKSGFGKAAARTALLLVLIILGFAVYRYEGPLLSLERFVPSADKVMKPTLAKKPIRRHLVRQKVRPIRNAGEIRRFDRSGNVYTFHAPGISGGSFSVQGPFPGLQNPPLRASDSGPSANEPKIAGPGGNSKSFSGLQFIGLMATLHNDGALVEEGAPASSPPKRSTPQSILEHIVLDVMVGKNGEVKDVRLISSPDSKLAEAVIRSVRRWVYRPLYENGQAVGFTTRITLNFSKSSRLP